MDHAEFSPKDALSFSPKVLIRQVLAAAVTALLLTLLALFLYHHDNQYEAPGAQGEDGILILSQEELDSVPLHHLVTGWEYFPDVLLTPQMLQENPHAYPSQFVSVNPYEFIPRTRGTYRLTLSLPTERYTYSLKIPVIYSAYQFYVGDEQRLQIGNPQDGAYRDVLQEQVISFRSGGYVQLLIAYSGDSDSYCGMFYPPTLGRSLSIHRLGEYEQIFLSSSVTLLCLAALLCLYHFFLTREENNLFLCLTCLFVLGYVSHPLIRSFCSFGTYPWRSIRMLCYFGANSTLVFSCAYFCHWQDRFSRFLRGLSLIVFVGAVGTFVLLPLLPLPLPDHISLRTTQILLLLTAINAVFLMLRVLCTNHPRRLILSVGSTVFCFFPLVKLLLPNHAPVITTHFLEFGLILLMTLFLILEFYDLSAAYQFRLTYEERLRQTEHLLKLEEVHYRQLQDQIDSTRRTRHDLRQHLRLIRSMLDQGDLEELAQYLDHYTHAEGPLLSQPIQFAQVPVVDALLSYYWNAAKQQGADFEAKCQLQKFPQEMSVDLCTVLGNLLENALESIQRQEEGPRFIRVVCRLVNQQLLLEVVNTNTTPVRRETGGFRSSKRDELGIGTLSVRMIAKQYGGITDFHFHDGQFFARVLLPLRGNPQEVPLPHSSQTPPS